MRRRTTLILFLTVPQWIGCISNRFTRAVERAERRSSSTAAVRGGDGQPQPIDENSSEPVSVLSINSDQVTVEDILKPIRKDLERRARTAPTAEYGRYLVETIQKRVQTVARDTLLVQEASKNLTDREEEMFDDIVDEQIRKRVNREFSGRQARFEHALADQGRTLADERAAIRRELIITRWVQLTVHRKIADPTREDLVRAFRLRRDALVRPPRRDMRIIEIAVASKRAALADDEGALRSPAGGQALTKDQLKKCRDLALRDARSALAELTAGADFADVAQKYSTGWHKQNGGRFGWVSRGGVRERLQPAVEALFELPDIDHPSDIIETPEAFFIVQPAAIDAGEEPDFASVQPQLIEQYRRERYNELVEDVIRKLHRDAVIRPANLNRFLQAVALAAPQPGLSSTRSHRASTTTR